MQEYHRCQDERRVEGSDDQGRQGIERSGGSDVDKSEDQAYDRRKAYAI